MSKRTLVHIILVVVLAIAALLLVRLHAAGAQTLDPHKLYEEKCARCHQPHAYSLVREHLMLEEGKVVTKAGSKAVASLLASHARQALPQGEIDALVKQFGAMLKTGWLFQDRCFSCHGPASVFARTTLKLAGGNVVSKGSSVAMSELLKSHGGLYDDAQRATILEMLKRQLETQ